MFLNLFFKHWSLTNQINFLKKKGVLIGSRTKENRKIYVYMHEDLFAEVMFKNDNPSAEVERGCVVKGLKNLNSYLENEFRTSF